MGAYLLAARIRRLHVKYRRTRCCHFTRVSLDLTLSEVFCPFPKGPYPKSFCPPPQQDGLRYPLARLPGVIHGREKPSSHTISQ
jgi:hypothetical protein